MNAIPKSSNISSSDKTSKDAFSKLKKRKMEQILKKNVDLPKPSRIDLRLDPAIKDLFLQGSALSGSQNLSNFIVSTVCEKSVQLINEHQKINLSNESWQLVMSMLENPPKPNAALIRAAKKYKDLGFD